jgi:gliding motility-associated-like protein
MFDCPSDSVRVGGTPSASGGRSPYTYSWTPSTGIVSSTTIANPYIRDIDTTTLYTLTVTDPVNGCTSTGNVIVNPTVGSPIVSVGATQTLTCLVTSLNLNASSTTSAVTYNWAGTGIVSGGSSASPTVNTSGTYTVTITDPSNGCTSTAIQTVNANTTAPIANAGADLFLACSVTTINLDGSGSSSGANYTYNWTTSGGSILAGASTISAAAGQPGNYTVTVTDITNGCTSTDNVTVTGDTLPVAFFTASPTSGFAPLVVDFTNGSSGAVSYVWNLGDGSSSSAFNPSNTYNTFGDYIITLTALNSSGCADTFSITIHVDQLSLLTIPNVFTPNGDGENDIFRPIIAENLSRFKATIFDRWGLKIYEWADVNAGWNGQTKNGAPANDGTYYYIINGKGVDGKEYIYNGYLQLLRVK